nr:hypothetical protein [Tanacetum cinerariifolium]
MRTKPELDTLSFDDLYNNLRVFERNIKVTTASSSNTQNVAFVSAENTSSTDDVTMISIRIKKFHKRTGRKLQFDTKDPVGFNKTKVECFNYHKMEHFARDCRAKGNQDSRRRDAGYNGNKTKDNDRRPAYQDDSKALVTIDGNDIDWSGHIEEDAQNYAMMAYSSSNSGSDNESVFMNKANDLEDTPVNDRFADGMHAVSPPITGNYIPSRPNVETYYFKFTYGSKQTSADESDSKHSEYASCESDSSVETSTSMPEPIKNTSKVVCEPKVWTDDPIIEEYKSDSDNDLVSNVQEDKEKSSFAFTDSVKHVKTSKENIKETCTTNHSPKIKKQDRNGHTRKGLGYAFTRKTCFVYGSFSHLIRDCDFHEKRMAKQAELTKSKDKDDPHRALKDKGIIDSGCSKHMTRNKAHLVDYQEFKGGFVAFGGSNGRITGKGKIKTDRLDFEDVYYVEELKHYNLFSVLQIYDKKNKVLFTGTDCLVLSPDFKLPDENKILLKIPRQHNMYSFNLKNIDPYGELACLFVKSLINESNKWHRRLEAVNTACYVLNRELVTKPQNKTPYELLSGKQPIISYLRPFECHVTILNTINQLGKFDGKSDSGFLVGYSLDSKAFRVYNLETKRVEENLHVKFLENKPNVTGKGHAWMFNLDYLTNSMNYEPVIVENQANKSVSPKEANNSAGTQANDDQGTNSEEINLNEKHFVLPIWSTYSTTVKSSGDKIKKNTGFRTCEKPISQVEQNPSTSSTKLINTASTPLSTVGPSKAFNDGKLSYLDPSKYALPDDPSMPHLEDIYANTSEGIFTDSSYDDEGVVTDFNNLETTMSVSLTPTTRIHTIHPKTQIRRDLKSTVQTKSKVNKNSKAHALKAIRTKWVYKNKKDKRVVVVRNKARLVSHGHRKEEGIDYDEVFAPVARIESIRIFLAFASYMGFIVYQMDVKCIFMYGTIDEEVYVLQPPSFVDPKFPNKAYKVVKALYVYTKLLELGMLLCLLSWRKVDIEEEL